jgi:hypothetical protein
MSDISVLDGSIDRHLETLDDGKPRRYKNRTFSILESDIFNALVAASSTRNIEGFNPQQQAILHPRHTIRGLQYTDYKVGNRECTIFFRTNSGPLVPGRIRQIFSIPRQDQDDIDGEHIFIAVQRYEPLKNEVNDPFKRFEDFGAALWANTKGEVEIILAAEVVCHANMRKWDDDVVVLRPLNRVRYFKT